MGWKKRERLARRAAPVLAAVLGERAGREVRRPVMIIGCDRSGTTLLHELLASHHAIAAYPSEANGLWHPSTYPWHRASVAVPPIWVDPAQFAEASLASRPRGHVRRLQAVFGAFQLLSGRPVLLNKSVMLNFMLPYVLEVFPESRFIHMVRDGRAVALSSAKFQRATIARAPGRYTRAGYDWPLERLVLQFGRYWAQIVRELDRQSEALGLARAGRWLELRYETLCDVPAAVLAETAAFIGVPRDGYGVRTYDHIINMNSRYRDELSEEMLSRVEPEIRPALTSKGYV